MNKKIIIILVEGDTDEAIINTLLADDKGFEIHVVRSDLFTQYNNQSIKSRIGDFIKNRVLRPYKLKKTDILSIIQISDIDGIYVSDNNVVIDSNVSGVSYLENSIKVANEKKKNEIISRNSDKVSKINQVITTTILDCEYKLFFFSCNLEHILFDELNLTQNQKEELVFKYVDENDINSIQLHLEKIALKKSSNYFDNDYQNSWDQMRNSNSNIRNTNVNLLKTYISNIKEGV